MYLFCKNNISNKGVRQQGLTEGKKYCVIGMVFDFGRPEVSYHLIDDFGSIGYYTQEFFDISDNKIGSDWVLVIIGQTFYQIMPESIAYPGFLEDYHNDDPIAIETLKKRFPEYADILL